MLITDQLEEAKGKLSYVCSVLAQPGLADWEIAEYSALRQDYRNEVERLNEYVHKYHDIIYNTL